MLKIDFKARTACDVRRGPARGTGEADHHTQHAKTPLAGALLPTASGDFLYGVGVFYECGPPTIDVGAGWNASNAVYNCFSKRDEWRVHNSTAPIGATFPTSSGGFSYAATVAIRMH